MKTTTITLPINKTSEYYKKVVATDVTQDEVDMYTQLLQPQINAYVCENKVTKLTHTTVTFERG